MEHVGDTIMIGLHGDGTFAIPDGNDMYEFAYEIVDNSDGMKEKAEALAQKAIRRNKELMESGVDCLFLCSDYCYNSGPFLSHAMLVEFIYPYLYKTIFFNFNIFYGSFLPAQSFLKIRIFFSNNFYYISPSSFHNRFYVSRVILNFFQFSREKINISYYYISFFGWLVGSSLLDM